MRTLGRYELLRPLARGGMAEVYLARRRVAGVEKRLVIKRLRRERIADPRFLDLFVKEAQLSMALVQQNIVPVFDFGRVGDDVFLAMEHIDGKDLGSSLARHKGAGMPPLIAAFIAAECCHALHHAHTGVVSAAGASGTVVVHRDVTPRNVLLSWSGEVKLADFGIAAAIGAGLTGDTSLVGTPAYLAPEQARGQPVDARTDLYSLGLVLWEMLVGERVRGGHDASKLLGAAAENQLPPLPSSLPAALAEVIRRATATAPRDRLDSARAMADLLDSFIIGERARHGGPAPAQRLAAWLRERWAGAGEDVVELADEAGGAVATFLDDGAAGVLGTGTLRSMAVTAGPAGEQERSPAAASSTASAEGASTRIADEAGRRAGEAGPPAGETNTRVDEAGRRAGEAGPPAGETNTRVDEAGRRADEARDRAEKVAARAAAPGASATEPSPRAAAGPVVLDDPPRARALAPHASRRSRLLVGASLFAALAAVAAVTLSQLDRQAAPTTPPPADPGASPLATVPASSPVPSPGGAASTASSPPAGIPSAAASSMGSSSAPSSSSSSSSPSSLSGPASSSAGSTGHSSSPASSSSASATGAAPAAASSSAAQSSPPSSPSAPPIVAHRPAPPSPSRRPPADPATDRATPSPAPVASSPSPSAPAASPAAASRRAFTIGARPWAHFTIDGDARVYETPATVELTLGPHRIRYENPTLGVASEVTITVTADGPSSHLQVLR